MISFASKATTAVYQKTVKPVLFRFPPDQVHNAHITAGKLLQPLPPFRGMLRGLYAYENHQKLSQTLDGITYRNPIGLSAGFDKNFEVPLLMKSFGYGFMEGGSLTFEQCDGNPRPWFHRLKKTQSIAVHAGVGNHGSEEIIKHIQSYPDHAFKDFPLNISVAKTNSPGTCTDVEAIADYIGSLKAIKQAGVGNVVTINISCPNTYGGEPFTTPERLDSLLSAIDEVELKQPMFIKMPIDKDWAEFSKLVEVISKHKIAGLTIGNLAKDRSKLELKDPLPDSIKGGLSGKPTWHASNELIRQTYLHYSDRFVISGVGGVFSAEDAYTKIKLGASLVQLITGMIFHGPQLIGQINKGLVELLEKDGYSHISEAVGTEAKKS